MKRKTLLETIERQIGNEIIAEGPFSSVAKMKMLDPIAGAASGVGNMFSNIRGQFNLGRVNKKLQRSADRIQDEWESASKDIEDKAGKMANASNPKVKQMGAGVMQNKERIDNQIGNAVEQMKQMSTAGADQGATQGGSDDDQLARDVAPRQTTDKYGNVTTEYGVDRWLKRMGIDPNSAGKTLKNHLSKLFMDLVSNNINPLKVPIKKQMPIINYAKGLSEQLQAGMITPAEFEQQLKKVTDSFLAGQNPNEIVNPAAPGGSSGKAKGLTPDEVEQKIAGMKQPQTKAGAGGKTPPSLPLDSIEKELMKKVTQQAATQNMKLDDAQKANIEAKIKQAVAVAARMEKDPKKIAPAALKYLQQFKSPPPAPAPSQAKNPAVFAQPPAPGQPPAPPPSQANNPKVFQQPPQLKPGEFMKPPPVEKPKFEPPPSQEEMDKFEAAAKEYGPAAYEKPIFKQPPAPTPPAPPEKAKFVQPPPASPQLDMPPEEQGAPQKLGDFMEPQLSKGLPVKDNGNEITVGSQEQPGFGPKAATPKKAASKNKKAKPKSKKKSK